MTSDKERKKLTDILRWLGASKEGFTQGLLGRYTILAQAKIEAITPKGINTTPNQPGCSKAPSDHHHPQEAEGTKLRRKIKLTTEKAVLFVPWRG
jgi:hypothetical protein